ncbi:hypothetical protein HAX54_038424, partial [Datura stramonium]|nr:hypothetical protein [Datura stramonium]
LGTRAPEGAESFEKLGSSRTREFIALNPLGISGKSVNQDLKDFIDQLYHIF